MQQLCPLLPSGDGNGFVAEKYPYFLAVLRKSNGKNRNTYGQND
jgi:hypothetical protein